MIEKTNKNICTLPNVSIVVIGLNVEKFLGNCINAVFNSKYPHNKMDVIYVDSGSKDHSVEIATSFENVRIVELKSDKPSAAKGRNAGLRIAKHELIQFVDADSYLHPNWLFNAVGYLNHGIAAVAGNLNERFPKRNWIHRVSDLEWNLRSGKSGWTTTGEESSTFGGNVIIRKEVLNICKGYDENLNAGEDPDLSYRTRQLGFKIYRINEPMASHDINISSFRQFNIRSKRSGFAYAQLAAKYWRNKEKFMLQRIARIMVGAVTPIMVLSMGFFFGYPTTGLVLSLVIAFRLLFKIGKFARLFNIKLSMACVYSLYLAYVVYPQFFGVIQGFWQGVTNKFHIGNRIIMSDSNLIRTHP